VAEGQRSGPTMLTGRDRGNFLIPIEVQAQQTQNPRVPARVADTQGGEEVRLVAITFLIIGNLVANLALPMTSPSNR